MWHGNVWHGAASCVSSSAPALTYVMMYCYRVLWHIGQYIIYFDCPLIKCSSPLIRTLFQKLAQDHLLMKLHEVLGS